MRHRFLSSRSPLRIPRTIDVASLRRRCIQSVWSLHVLLACSIPSTADAQSVLHWLDLTSEQVARLDRARTVILIPSGIVEEHGPFLPNGAELMQNVRLTNDLAAAIVNRPGWTVVLAPTIPLGSGAFDRRSGRNGFGGTLSVRAATVQAVFSDLAENLGQQGFRQIFVVNGHADANHDRALDAAGDAFFASYRGLMVHLLGRRGCHVDALEPPPITMFSANAMTADTDSPHGGAIETARFWWVRPDLIDSTAVRRAADVPAKGASEWVRSATSPGWRGYVGAPRFATLELGEWLYETQRRNCSDLALRLLDGLDERAVPRYGDQMRAFPDIRQLLDAQERAEAEELARRNRALARQTQRP